jgi:hypothetical protein
MQLTSVSTLHFEKDGIDEELSSDEELFELLEFTEDEDFFSLLLETSEEEDPFSLLLETAEEEESFPLLLEESSCKELISGFGFAGLQESSSPQARNSAHAHATEEAKPSFRKFIFILITPYQL